jgi:aldose 1-epimerase
MELTKELWGNHDGQEVFLFKLKNEHTEVHLSNFGATITAIITLDKAGHQGNIVLGYDSLREYIEDEFYVGCIVGRFAGRIAGAQFSINNQSYNLAKNDGENSLHGGNKGFNKQVFTVSNETLTNDIASAEFHYRSPYLEEGYPGNLDIWVNYSLSSNNELTINYKAVTDADTHINLTNHSYFNLSGIAKSVLAHQLFINADNYLVTDKNYIPTGEIKPVKDTPFDFKIPHPIADRITELDSLGYNECYILNKNNTSQCAVLHNEESGRKLVVETDAPSLLFYSGDYLKGRFVKNGGICLETQFYPDAPNHPHFPSTLLKAGDEWSSYTKFIFSAL